MKTHLKKSTKKVFWHVKNWKLIVLAREKNIFYIFSEKYFEKINKKMYM